MKKRIKYLALVLISVACLQAAPVPVTPPGDPVNPEISRLTLALSEAKERITLLEKEKLDQGNQAQDTLNLVLQQRNDANSNLANTQIILRQTNDRLAASEKKVTELTDKLKTIEGITTKLKVIEEKK